MDDELDYDYSDDQYRDDGFDYGEDDIYRDEADEQDFVSGFKRMEQVGMANYDYNEQMLTTIGPGGDRLLQQLQLQIAIDDETQFRNDMRDVFNDYYVKNFITPRDIMTIEQRASDLTFIKYKNAYSFVLGYILFRYKDERKIKRLIEDLRLESLNLFQVLKYKKFWGNK